MKRGEVTAIVGPTGAGKTTIVNLLMGLFQPSEGRILVDGYDLKEIYVKAWREKIGYVSQDVFLFNASIRDNIVLWEEKVLQVEVERAARVAQLHDFVQSLPHGYDTLVGDRGLRLSGGQCQRVAIARAIFRRPEVLIFDEATSALDNLTENVVYRAINALRKQATVVVIAHRLSTIRDADQIAVLSGGKVVELGTHASLVERRGIYAELYEEGAREDVSLVLDSQESAT
jgi:ABC-type multidrug transport system fused ATPase/permease subunit